MSALRRGGLCLLSACLIAGAVHSYTGPSGFSSVLGGDTRDGCREPCDDTTVKCRLECYHPAGGGDCILESCAINCYHLVECEAGDPVEEHECITDVDPGDWWRSWRHRDIEPEDCNDLGEDKEDAGECVFFDGDSPGSITPCGTDDCYGVQLDYIPVAGREICDD